MPKIILSKTPYRGDKTMLETTTQYLDVGKTEYAITMQEDTILEAIEAGGYSDKMKGISSPFSVIFGSDVFGHYFYGTRGTWLNSFLKSFKRLFNVQEKTVRVALFKFNHPSTVIDGENLIDEETVYEQMKKDGYIPGRTIHLLNFGINHPKIPGDKFMVLALGTQAYRPHNNAQPFVPALIGGNMFAKNEHLLYACRSQQPHSIKVQFLGIRRADNNIDEKNFIQFYNSYC